MFKTHARLSFPRTFDEAFHTPRWYTPIEGPYRHERPAARHSHWVVLALVLAVLSVALAVEAQA